MEAYKSLVDASTTPCVIVRIDPSHDDISFAYRNPRFIQLQDGTDSLLTSHKDELLEHWKHVSDQPLIVQWHGQTVTIAFENAAEGKAVLSPDSMSSESVATAISPSDGDLDPHSNEDDEEIERSIWKHLLQQIPACAVVLSPEGKIRYMSKTLSQVYRTEQEEFTASDLVHLPEEYTAFHDDGSLYDVAELPLARTLAKRESVKGESVQYKSPHGNGSLRYTCLPVFDPGDNDHCIALIGIIEDTRDATAVQRELVAIRAEKEAVIRSNKLKDEFISMISHELRTPIHGIIGYLDILEDDGSEQCRNIVAQARQTVNVLQRTVDNLFTTRKMQEMQVEIAKVPVSPRRLVKDVVSSLDGIIADSACKIVTQCDDKVREAVMLDEQAISNALCQILHNAVKFAKAPEGESDSNEPGEIKIVVSIASSSDEQSSQVLQNLRIAISNPGPLPDKVMHSFGKFVQGTMTSTRDFGGVGLGLSIAHNLARLHGGRLSCTSGAITTFTLEVPAIFAAPTSLPYTNLDDARGSSTGNVVSLKEESPFKAGKRANVQDSNSGMLSEQVALSNLSIDTPRTNLIEGNKHIIVAEDDKINGMILMRTLKKANYVSTLAVDGQKAVEAFEQADQCDLIIMECVLTPI